MLGWRRRCMVDSEGLRAIMLSMPGRAGVYSVVCFGGAEVTRGTYCSPILAPAFG